MAQRRMFSPDIVCSDAFLDMPSSSRDLYFQLGMYADDDGFVNPRKIMRMISSSEDDIKILISKRFVLQFPSGVVVVKHWKINNLVRKDWYRPTQYIEEKLTLTTKENGSYTELNIVNNKLVNETTPNSLTQVRLGKVSIGKDIYTSDVKSHDGIFSLEEEIKKLEDNPRRDLNIVALFLDFKKPDIKTYEQFQVALKRHLRPAKELVPFTDNQIIDAIPKAKKSTLEFTLETLVKVLIK